MCADNASAPLFLLLWPGFMGRSPWNALTEQPESCLVLKSCLCARFCPSLLQDRKRNYPSFSAPSAHKGKKKGGEWGVLSQCAACIFLSAACDSSSYSRLFLPVPGSSRLCRYDGPQDEIRGGDNLRINTASLPSSAAGRFSQTMTQSLGVVYFRLLLVRSCVKSGGGAVSGTGNVSSPLQNKREHGRPSPPCNDTQLLDSAKFFLRTSSWSQTMQEFTTPVVFVSS